MWGRRVPNRDNGTHIYQSPDSSTMAGLQHMTRSLHNRRICIRYTLGGRGEMINFIALPDRLTQRVRLLDVAANALDVDSRQRLRITGGTHEGSDLMAVVQQVTHEMGPEVTIRSDHQCIHLTDALPVRSTSHSRPASRESRPGSPSCEDRQG